MAYSQPNVYSVSPAPDGDVFVAVTDGVQRLNPDGSPDPAFGSGGFAPFPAGAGVRAVALPDGGVLLLGGGSSSFTVTRLTPAGVVDPTFGTGGTATIGFGDGTAAPTTAAVGPDGRIVVVGSLSRPTTLEGFSITLGEMAATRLTSTGQIDSTFGDGGRVTVAVPVDRFNHAGADSVSLGPDGRVVLGGFADQNGYKNTHGGSAFWTMTSAPAAVRLTSDGRLDPAFGTGGRVVVPVRTDGPLFNIFRATQVLDDGRVLLAGPGTPTDRTQPGESDALAVRLTGGGQPDPTYGFGGRAIAFVGRDAVVAIDAQHRVVFVGTGALYRLTADGALDPGFGANGRKGYDALPGVVPAGDTFDVQVAAAQPNGDILVGLTTRPGGTGTPTGRVIRLVGVSPPAGFTPAAAGTFVAGGPADGTVQVLSRDGTGYAAAEPSVYLPGVGPDYRPGTAVVTFPFDTPTGSSHVTQNVRPVVADVTGDGTPDYVLAAGPGGPPRVVVLDGATGRVAADFAPFESSFTGGVSAAAADLDGDGRAEVAVAPDQGGGGRVVVYSVAAGGGVTQRASFFGIDDPNFRGGARVAFGDVDKDGRPDLVVAAGFGGGPRVAVFGGTTVLGGTPARLVNDFFAFPGTDAVNLRNGAYVAAGDVTGDGFADLVFGGGPGGAPRVFILSGALVSAGSIDAAYAAPVANFFVAGNSTDRGGVRVATADADGDTRADVAAGSGAGEPARVRVYLGKDFAGPTEPAAFQDLNPFGGAVLADGVFVG